MPLVVLTEPQRLEVDEIGSGLGDGEQSKVSLCPVCLGGSGGEASFSVKRSGTKLLYICHRDTCKAKGIIGSWNGVTMDRMAPKDKDRSWKYDTVSVPPWIKATLMAGFSLTHTEQERFPLRYSEERERLLIPVLNRHKKFKGWVARQTKKAPGPKSLNYITEGEDFAWYITSRTQTAALLIVEDPISAIRGSTYVDSCALLGTNLTMEKLREIAEAKYETVWLALDKDALATAAKIVRENKIFLPNIRLLALPKDLKNMNRIELETFLTESGVVLQ